MTNSTKAIIGALVAVLLLGGIVWAISSGSDEADQMANESTSQSTNEDNSSEAQSAPDIVALAQETPQLSTLVDALVAAELTDTLSGDGPYTVFAPTNDAFAALPEGTLEDLLLPENQQQLTNVLTYHVVEGDMMSSDLSNGQTVTTLQGQDLTVEIRDGNVYINNAMVVTADVEASNGVVHIIDGVLLPE